MILFYGPNSKTFQLHPASNCFTRISFKTTSIQQKHFMEKCEGKNKFYSTTKYRYRASKPFDLAKSGEMKHSQVCNYVMHVARGKYAFYVLLMPDWGVFIATVISHVKCNYSCAEQWVYMEMTPALVWLCFSMIWLTLLYYQLRLTIALKSLV